MSGKKKDSKPSEVEDKDRAMDQLNKDLDEKKADMFSFAGQFPDWDLLPPAMVVRRIKRNTNG